MDSSQLRDDSAAKPIDAEAVTQSMAKEAEIESNKFTYLKPVIHETKIMHQTEEITRRVERERHIHSVHLHEIPLQRPRKIVTRVRISLETEVLPEEYTPEELEYHSDRKSLPKIENGRKDCNEPGRYQAYAQVCHDRAVALVGDQLSHTLRFLDRNLATNPPITKESQVAVEEGTKRSLAILHGQI